MICVNEQGKAIVLEFKTGYGGYFALDHPTRFFTGCMSRRQAALPLSVKNFARMQVWFAMQLLHRKHNVPYSMMEGYVVHAEHGKVCIHGASTRFARDHEEEMWCAVYRFRARQDDEKKKTKKKAHHIVHYKRKKAHI